MADEATDLLDHERIEGWLRTVDGFGSARLVGVEPLDGYSSINRRLELADALEERAVLKVQPASGIFEPYDVLREATVLQRLAASEVPVPGVLGEEQDPAVLGAPFFAMEWIDAPHMGVAADGDAYGSFFAMVARVHGVDWQALGLDVLGVPDSAHDGYLAEVRLVAERMEAQGVQDGLLHEAQEQLLAVPATGGRLGLCQGDVNVFNYLVRGGDVVGVVDWEQARISDPRSDLGQLLALLLLTGASPWGPADEDPAVARYVAAGGTGAEGLEPFRALWLYQLGFIHRAFVAGKGEQPWYRWEQIAELLPRSLDLLDR